jgi:mycothiol synthase
MSTESPDAVAPTDFEAIRDRVARIEEQAIAADGYPSLNEAIWRDLDLDVDVAERDSAGFFVDDVAYAHVARSDNFQPRHWALGVTVAPDARATGARAAALAAALAHVAAHGGGRAVLWVMGASDRDDAELARLGLLPDRSLYEMRVTLPIAERPRLPAGIEVRTFEPGRDEDAWLTVNNRAFQNHAEQGGWIRETLLRREQDAWFDPSLFFLGFDAEGLAGFNWLKIHDAHGRADAAEPRTAKRGSRADGDPRVGEIFVIGVDPRAQGTGLGRALAIIGLDAVHARGIDTGSLFTAAENNEGVLHLYRALGFTVHRTDRAYEVEVPEQ